MGKRALDHLFISTFETSLFLLFLFNSFMIHTEFLLISLPFYICIYNYRLNNDVIAALAPSKGYFSCLRSFNFSLEEHRPFNFSCFLLVN